MNYEEQSSELEAIQYIFMDYLTIKEERPYKFDVVLNSHSEKENNHLVLKLTFELPDAYPNEAPLIRIKNLALDIIDNNKILDFEKLVNEKAEQSLGTPMIYEICEALREILSEMNEMILKRLRVIEEKDSVDNALKQVKISDAPLSFTPVNRDTFALWCE